MYEIVKSVVRVDIIDLEELNKHNLSSKIIVCEKVKDPTHQNLLVKQAECRYFWTNFYMRHDIKRTRYASVYDAIESRYEKGYRVYMFYNKTELKAFIKTR